MKLSKKEKWNNFYSIEDPYGYDKWFSDKMRRKLTFDLVRKRGLMFNNCLELGSGEGRVTSEMLDFCKKITCVEISPIAIERSKKRNKDFLDRIYFINEDMYNIKLEKNSFNFINAMESLDYTKKREEQINKWLEWLTVDGYILFPGPNLKGYFNWKELKNLFVRKNLEICEIKAVTSKFPFQFLINRIPVLQHEFFYSVNLLITNSIPQILGKHMAILIKKVNKNGKNH